MNGPVVVIAFVRLRIAAERDACHPGQVANGDNLPKFAGHGHTSSLLRAKHGSGFVSRLLPVVSAN
jgi:hypothetical protein